MNQSKTKTWIGLHHLNKNLLELMYMLHVEEEMASLGRNNWHMWQST